MAVGLAVLALKLAAWALTGSVALLSDALESIVNVAAAGLALWALWLAAHPADREHPYGHHKAEYLSAVMEGALIVVAALIILHEAGWALFEPRRLEAPWTGLVLNGVATALNAVWAAFLIRAGRRWRSPAIGADGLHLLADVVTSVGVIGGIALAVAFDLAILDPILAGLVAINILWMGQRLVRRSVAGLMDAAPDPETLERVRRAIAVSATGALEAHDVRTRHAGRASFVEFHLVVPGDWTVAEAHAVCDRIEAALKQELDGAIVTIHVEPEDKAKQEGVPVL
ncbi:MAG: cation diffusion facilitator family transporter [Alphaproteobacteria bacterium]|nr:cation diffusion facilitator family transporter [Alphaproteobacteria bacterium]